jgi:DNA polymerase-3 subunit delta'
LGVVKATCARALAAAINCEEAAGEGCGHCTSCHKIQEGLHPDLIHVEPEGQVIVIGQVRAIETHLGYPPHEGRYRTVIIDGADKLNPSAANALLKSVEEPFSRTIFVLVAASGHLVTPTLVSRCQRIRFLPLRRVDLELLLERYSEADESARTAAAAMAEGSAGRALRLLEGDQMSAIKDLVNSLLAAVEEEAAIPLFDAASEAGRDRKVLNEALDVLRLWLRDLLLCQQGLDSGGRVVNSDKLDLLREQARRLTRPALVTRLRAVDEAQAALRGNVHPALTLENLVLRMRQTAAR